MAAAAALALGGCSDNESHADEEPKAPASTTSSAPASADPAAAEEKQVLETYAGYWDAKYTAYSKASAKGTKLKEFSTAEAFSKLNLVLRALDRDGQVAVGEPEHQPEVADLDLEAKIPQARISDCLDVSDWKLVDRTTRELIEPPEGRRTEFLSVVTIEKWGKRWLVIKDEPQDRPC